MAVHRHRFTALLMLLAAVDEGLGAVFSGPPEIADFRTRFRPPARASERNSLGELVHRGRW